MCGIVGYTGKRQATPILLHGLEKLEYRGYDSAGIAVQTHGIHIVKTKGRLQNLLPFTSGLTGNCGVGHTRWATHGEPSQINAHPHQSSDGKVALVHNGILENYAELKAELLSLGYTFRSQTDTEVIANFLARRLALGETPLIALRQFAERARGTYAVAVLFEGYSDEIYAARKDSPLIVGVGEGETYLASDVSALLAFTRKVYYVDDGETVRLTRARVEFFNEAGDPVRKTPTEITWSAEGTEKGGYPHFMLKEIHEQPQAVRNTLRSFERVGLTQTELREIEELYIVACGSAYHAGVAAAYAIEGLAKLPVRVELASVVNVRGSAIAREADLAFYTVAGPEIAVATTKAYSTQLIAGYLLALELAKARGKIDEGEYARLYRELQTLPRKMEEILQKQEEIEALAKRLTAAQNIFFIGRGVDYAVSLEGSLKMKEISYIHSEAYAAGELKHGTLSLIEEGVWTVSVLTQSRLTEKTLSNIMEVKSRGGSILAVATEGTPVEEIADGTIFLPKTEEVFSASLAVIPLQLLSYFVSVARGLDVDKPRNLAKSVTVE